MALRYFCACILHMSLLIKGDLDVCSFHSILYSLLVMCDLCSLPSTCICKSLIGHMRIHKWFVRFPTYIGCSCNNFLIVSETADAIVFRVQSKLHCDFSIVGLHEQLLL